MNNYIVLLANGNFQVFVVMAIFLVICYVTFFYPMAKKISSENQSRAWVIQDIKLYGWIGLGIILFGVYLSINNFC
jgi:hypothetical protein